MSNRSSRFVHPLQSLPSALAGGPRRLLALAAVLALLVLALLPNAGQAQTPAPIWSGTLTVGAGSFGAHGCNNTITGSECSSLLDDDDFIHDGTTYTITLLESEANFLYLEVDKDLGEGTDALELHVGNNTFLFGAANTSSDGYKEWVLFGFTKWALNATVLLTIPGVAGGGTPPPATPVVPPVEPPVIQLVVFGPADLNLSATGLDTHRIGDWILLDVWFSEEVTVTGDPQLALNIGSVTRMAEFDPRHTDGQNVRFRYKVKSGDEDTDGVAIPANALTLNGGTISSAGGTAATLTRAAAADDPEHKVDGLFPTLLSAETSADGATVILTYSEQLTATESPPLDNFMVTIAGSARTVSSGAVSGTEVTLTLASAVAAGETVTLAYAWNSLPRSRLIRDLPGNRAPVIASGSEVINNSIIANAAPDFSAESATRDVAENSPPDTNVGEPVTATDDDDDTLTYSLEGTDAASFDIVPASGQIQTKAGVTYDHEANPSYSLIVKADDSNGGTNTIAITIAIGDVDEPPSAPATPTVTAVAGTSDSLSVSWTAPDNSGKPDIASYDLQYRKGTTGTFTDGPEDERGTTATINGLDPASAYQVQVRATNDEGDSDWSSPGSGTTNPAAPPPNQSPTVQVTADPMTVSAGAEVELRGTGRDPDGDDLALTYLWTAHPDVGSFDNKTVLNGSWTAPEAAQTVTLTVTVTDPAGASASATVEVTVQGLTAKQLVAADRAALIALYDSTGGEGWDDNTNWGSDEPLGNWSDVSTNADGRVTHLVVNFNNLSGTLPAQLGNLTSLEELDLAGNQLRGPIPDLSRLTNLVILNLTQNQLTEDIPAALGALTSLEQLFLWGNQLRGPIPAELGALTSLRSLDLSRNQLTGEIPDSLRTLTSLTSLYLSRNQLTGEIPDSLRTLISLEYLHLGRNQLSGPIPDLSGLTGLFYLDLSRNQLTGEPDWLGDLTFLLELHLNENQLSGPIPDLNGLIGLEELYLSDNQLSGPIPDLSGLISLVSLYLSQNQLTGEIPDLNSLTKLRTTRFANNHLTGCVPHSLRSRLDAVETDGIPAHDLIAVDANHDGDTDDEGDVPGLNLPFCMLSALTLSGLDLNPAFAPGTAAYTAATTMATTTLTATLYHPSDGLSVSNGATPYSEEDAIPLEVGSNLITIEVTPTDERLLKRTYTVDVFMGGPIIRGALLVGSLLTVDIPRISDVDTNFPISYQWIRIHASGDVYETNPQTGEVILFRQDGDEFLLGHAQEKTYRPTVHDIGSRLYVVVSYSGRGGMKEMRTPATERITAPGKLAGDFDLPSGIGNPRGIWGNDETIWVPDVTAQIYPTIWAVDRATRHREPAKDFTPAHLDADNIRISGIWSDGATMYVVNSRSIRDMIDGKIYAYSLDDKSRVEEKDIDLASGNEQPRGSWGNATTLWVVNDGDSGDQEGEVDKVFAYRLTDDPDTEENEYGAPDPDQDFDTLEADGVGAPAGIWSDGTTMWVVDRLDRKAYAYAMSDRSRLSDQDITLDADNALAAGAWGDIDASDIDAGEVGTLWVVDNEDKKLYAYTIRHTTPSLRSNDGLPIIIGTPMVGQTLTPDTSRIGDPQGLPDDVVFGCQWLRVVDGRDLYINQSWNCSYTVPWRYVGLPLKVEVNFHDARGAYETRRSDATDPVAWGPISNGFVPTVDGTDSLEILRGLWGNDETIWVSKAPTATVRDDPRNPGDEYNYALTYVDNLLLAYNRSDGSRAIGQDIRLHVGEDPHLNWAQYNTAPGNIWSDGETMFVVDNRDDKIYAYDLDDGSYDPDRNIDLASDNNGAMGIWGNDETIWVGNVNNRDSLVAKIFAYQRTDGARDPDQDFNTLDDNILDGGAGIKIPLGICSDGTTMWVVATSVFAFSMSDKSRDQSKELNFQTTNLVPRGAWCEIGTSDKGTLWVADRGTKKLYTYEIAVQTLQSALGQAEPPTTAPSAVRGLTADVGGAGITLSWREPEDNGGSDMVFYRVERKTEGPDYAELDSGTLETGYLDPSPPASGPVSYRVTPYNAAGEGLWLAVALILAPAPADSPLTGAPSISGTARVGQTLTADTSGIADEDGLENAEFTYQWIRNDGTEDADIPGATGSTHTPDENDVGKTLKVRVSFTDDADNGETLTSPPTAAVTAPPLTATLDSVPASHDGATEFTFELHFSEEFKLSYTVLRDDDAFTVTGGTITKATRVKKGFNIKRKIQVEPDGNGDVTIVLPVTTDCAPDGAICTVDGRKLSARLERTVSGPGGAPATTDEPAPNTQATGQPTISGTVQVGETLTADVTGIADEDGLTQDLFSYQWRADDVAIAGASGSSYTLTKAEQGKTVTVTVSFTDDAGHEESLPSAATDAVAAKPNSAAMGAPTINGTARVGETLTADTSGIADADGLTNVVFSYQWVAEDTNIQDATGSSYILTEDDEGKTIKVTVSFTDDDGNPETLPSYPTGEVAAQSEEPEDSSEDDPAPENTLATGAPSISGTALVGQTLTADTSGIADEDGLDNVTFSYQWMADDANIQGATGSSYTIADRDEGKAIKVIVSFTDDANNEESLPSAATDAVTALPGKPQSLAGEATAQEIQLTWKAPTGPAVVEYVVYRGTLQNGSMNGQALSKYATIEATDAAMTYTDGNVEEGVEYRYRVAAVNADGEGKKSTWLDITAK